MRFLGTMRFVHDLALTNETKRSRILPRTAFGMRKVLILLTFLVSGAGVWACGDKLMLVMGLRPSHMRLSRPATILGYTRLDSPSSKLIRDLRHHPAVKKAGHNLEFVEDMAKLDGALKTGKYDLVLADMAVAGELSQRLNSAPSRPVVLPVAYNAAKADQSAAQKRFHCLLRVPSGPDHYLEAIDQAMQWRARRP
jgi:CheY-like chemotaxis protein